MTYRTIRILNEVDRIAAEDIDMRQYKALNSNHDIVVKRCKVCTYK